MNWTAVEAEQLNRERAIRGPAGDLVLLRFEGRDADPVYSVLKTYPESGGANGWGSSSAKKQDGGFYTQCQVADVDGEALSVLTGKGRATHFAIGTELFEVLDELTERPRQQPLVWKFGGYEVGESYEP
jgi:hypothetical protein